MKKTNILYTIISVKNTIREHIVATGNSPKPHQAAKTPTISARIPATGYSVASIMAGKVITARVTYGT